MVKYFSETSISRKWSDPTPFHSSLISCLVVSRRPERGNDLPRPITLNSNFSSHTGNSCTFVNKMGIESDFVVFEGGIFTLNRTGSSVCSPRVYSIQIVEGFTRWSSNSRLLKFNLRPIYMRCLVRTVVVVLPVNPAGDFMTIADDLTVGSTSCADSCNPSSDKDTLSICSSSTRAR